MIRDLHDSWKLALLAALVVPAVGCSSMSFFEKERTTIITPAMRAAAVREMAPLAERSDAAQQKRLCEQLARQIQTEPDPIVRQEIQNTIAAFSTPLALNTLLAGLNDDDLNVRLTCCYRLGDRKDAAAIGPLSNLAKNDKDLDVRLAAIETLGKIGSPESIAALGQALSDRDPAIQFAGVQSLKSVSGQDFGNDVNAWQQYVRGEIPITQPEISVAERIKRYSPF